MPTDPPEFGPSGYLPERAARRARKIVLRAPMGMQWPIAAVILATVVLIIGSVFLITRTGAPRSPFTPVAQMADLSPGATMTVQIEATTIVLVRTPGRLSAFVDPGTDVAVDPKSGHLEAADGRAWQSDGRSVSGTTAPLTTLPVRLHDGAIYVDPSRP